MPPRLARALLNRKHIVRSITVIVGIALATTSTGASAHSGQFAHEDPAYAPAGPPTSSVSRYMKTVRKETLYAIGCNDGRAVYLGAAPPDSLVVLAFGMPVRRGNRFGASLFDDFASTLQIRRAALAYARGWSWCVGPRTLAHLELSVGTSNYGSEVTFGHGRAWAHMVNRANARLQADGRAWRIRITGGNDIETGWASGADTRAWVEGYASEALYPYYNFGAAGGCPPYGYCNGGWSVEDVWFAAWGRGMALVLPEIYADSGANAEQWYRMSRYSVEEHGRRLRFAGVMTQMRSCVEMGDPCTGVRNSPEIGWIQLWHALNGDRSTAQGLRFLTDISWQN